MLRMGIRVLFVSFPPEDLYLMVNYPYDCFLLRFSVGPDAYFGFI